MTKPVFRTYIPASPLSHFVNRFWMSEGYAPAHYKERVLPDGSMQIVINLHEDIMRLYDHQNPSKCRSLRGSAICGAHSGFVIIDTAEQASVIGVHFKPGEHFHF